MAQRYKADINDKVFPAGTVYHGMSQLYLCFDIHVYICFSLLTNDNIIKYTNKTFQGLVDLNFIWILQKTERFYFRHILLVEQSYMRLASCEISKKSMAPHFL